MIEENVVLLPKISCLELEAVVATTRINRGIVNGIHIGRPNIFLWTD